MTSATHIVTDAERKTVCASGISYDDAIRNLDTTYEPSDFGCESWDEVVAAWHASEDGLGDLLVVLASDYPQLARALPDEPRTQETMTMQLIKVQREIDRQTLKREGKIIIGEWGLGSPKTSGHIICAVADRDAVQAAYDAIREGDLSSGVLDDVIAAGGEHVVGL
jgi:hypothetical protein